MDRFPGFPEGKLKLTPVPETFFADLLPLIDNLLELKTTLHCLWLLHEKTGEMRHVTMHELEQDTVLMRGLEIADRSHRSARDALQEGLERTVARGTLLQVNLRQAGQADEALYFLNSESGRAAVTRAERGEWTPTEEGAPIRLEALRPNIFNLYEQNFGLIQSPLLVEQLKDAERTYPPTWIEEAFRIAVGNNARRWSYVRSILERWAREGKG